jgi:hypothetical protein
LLREEKLVRINTVADGIADDWNPMENNWWLIWVLEEDLVYDIEHD